MNDYNQALDDVERRMGWLYAYTHKYKHKGKWKEVYCVDYKKVLEILEDLRN